METSGAHRLVYAPANQLIAGDVPSPRKQRCRDGYRALVALNTLSRVEQRACQKTYRGDSTTSRNAICCIGQNVLNPSDKMSVKPLPATTP